MRQIIKCIPSIDELDVELFNRLNIGVEIQDFTEPNLSEEQRRNIIDNYKRILVDFKGLKSLHGPFLDLKPSSPDLLIREVSYKRYLDTIHIATELDLDYLIFHSQINPYLNESFISDLNNKQAKEFWEKILEETNFKGTILIENIFEETPKMLKEYIDTIDFSNIKINLDIGHAKVGKASLEDWIVSLKDHISYMHIHSNNGLYDQHQSPDVQEIKTLYHLLDKYDIQPALSLEYKINDIEEEIKKYL
ncbi:MAG: sugar phosphate isomerase/epimerase [Tissierella sp.]|nr:sugar phosphate isomerase/epimerase [Tissierella sp.]